jgi:BirA family transcriptional regulator, biotin operon repressor / biotin---[acetyl-CoA-carboxylase] ligase
VQTGGRGRHGRRFVSDAGGLWISAVLPADGPAAQWGGFSLRVGATLLRHLRDLGLPTARLRWPNDLMAGPRKLAGLLIEQPRAGIFIVGLGLNVTNAPWTDMPELRATSTSLAECMTNPPTPAALAPIMLEALAEAHTAMRSGGMAAAIDELNAHWRNPTPVELHLADGSLVEGDFLGLDPGGNPCLRLPAGHTTIIPHPSITRLVECANISTNPGGNPTNLPT